MSNTRRGIKTKYETTNFRSMLEARWAAFFDLIGWDWIYEPYELPGWIPDFLIQGKEPFLVEVKPCVVINQLVDECGVKAQNSNGLGVLLAGVSPWSISMGQYQTKAQEERNMNHESMDGLSEAHHGPIAWDRGSSWGTHPDLGSLKSNGMWGISVVHQTMHIHGYPGGLTGDYHYSVEKTVIDILWREAGNHVQWKR